MTRFQINRQTHQKKINTPPTHKKNEFLRQRTLHTFAFACQSTSPAKRQRQRQKSAISQRFISQFSDSISLN